VLNSMTDVMVAPMGAEFPGAGSPWANLSAVAISHVWMPNPVLAAKVTEACPAAFQPIHALPMKQLAATLAGLPTATQNRKHNVYKTRVNAGGDGASGPHPERGPA
jgi:hypothetical protein